MSDKARQLIADVYENFLLRDLTYATGGVIIITSIGYVSGMDLVKGINYISHDLFKLLAFLVISYFTGFLAQEGMFRLKIFSTHPTVPEAFSHEQVLFDKLRKNVAPGTLRAIERTIYLKHVGSAIGAASLVSSVALIVKLVRNCETWDVFILIGFILIALICRSVNADKLREQSDMFSSLSEEIKSKE